MYAERNGVGVVILNSEATLAFIQQKDGDYPYHEYNYHTLFLAAELKLEKRLTRR